MTTYGHLTDGVVSREQWRQHGLWDQWLGAPRLDLLAPAPEHAPRRPRPQHAAEDAEAAVLTEWADAHKEVSAALELARPIFASLPTAEDRQDAEQDLLLDLWSDGKLADAACVVRAARSLRADYWRRHYRHGATVALHQRPRVQVGVRRRPGQQVEGVPLRLRAQNAVAAWAGETEHRRVCPACGHAH